MSRLGLDATGDGTLKLQSMQAAKRHFGSGVKAGLEPAIRRDANAVASRAEPVAHGANEPDTPEKPWCRVELRHATLANTLELECRFEDDVAGNEALLRPTVALSHGHEFDKANLNGLLPCDVNEVRRFIVVHATHEHTVYLWRRETGELGGAYSVQSVRELADA